MTYLEQLRAKLAEHQAAVKVSLDARKALIDVAETEARTSFTPEETAVLDEHRAKLLELDADIDSVRSLIADAEADEARRKALPTMPNVIIKGDAPEATARAVSHMGRVESRDAAMRIIEASDSVVSLRSDQKDKVAKLLRTKNGDTDGQTIAERMILTENDNYRDAFAKVSLGQSTILTADESRALAEFAAWESRAMSSASASGGYGVPVLIDPTITLTSQGHVPRVLEVCRIETITTDTWKGVSSQGVTWSFDEEAVEVSDDAPTLAQPSVSVWEARGFVPFSNRIGMDYPGFAEEVGALLMAGYLDKIAAVTCTGTGSTQPYGIITALDANTNVEVVVTTDGGIYAQDITKVWTALGERYRDKATWMMSADFAEEVAAFGTNDQFSFQTSRLGDEVTQTLRGRPVKYTDYFPSYTSSTGAANWIVVGDFQNYLWVNRAGMSVEYVPHLFGTSNPGMPTGQRGLWAWARVGGDSINDLGFRLLQNQ